MQQDGISGQELWALTGKVPGPGGAPPLKRLRKTAEGDVHGVPHHMQDLGRRQHDGDVPQVPGVAQHFVHDTLRWPRLERIVGRPV